MEGPGGVAAGYVSSGSINLRRWTVAEKKVNEVYLEEVDQVVREKLRKAMVLRMKAAVLEEKAAGMKAEAKELAVEAFIDGELEAVSDPDKGVLSLTRPYVRRSTNMKKYQEALVSQGVAARVLAKAEKAAQTERQMDFGVQWRPVKKEAS